MHNLKIFESNELFSEFMNFGEIDGKEHVVVPLHLYHLNPKSYDDYTAAELKFHKSWEWLMPVVEKIESLPLHDKIQEVKDGVWGSCYATVDMRRDRCIIWLMPNWTIVNFFCGKGRLCATYNAVIEFILWYNENKI